MISEVRRQAPLFPHSAIGILHPPLRDTRFWLAQLAILVTFTVHEALDGRLGLPFFITPVPHQATLIIFALPIMFATVTFGMTGAIAATLSVMLLMVVDVFQEVSNAPDLRGDLATTALELAMFGVIAVVVGRQVESERKARRVAEIAGQRTAVYAANVLQAQEEERRRIAHELHDQPVQLLVHLVRTLDAPSFNSTKAREAAQNAIDSLRTIARGLRPPALDDLGLVASARSLVAALRDRARIESTFSATEPAPRLSPDAELALFRICQEALSNVERHSASHRVDVSISFKKDVVTLTVSDDGVGFDLKKDARNPSALGLIGMSERADLLGGHLDIRSSKAQGTTIRAVLPLHPA